MSAACFISTVVLAAQTPLPLHKGLIFEDKTEGRVTADFSKG